MLMRFSGLVFGFSSLSSTLVPWINPGPKRMSERDNKDKEIPVLREEETNDTEVFVFEEVVEEVARLLTDWVGLRARDSPTERVLSRTPLIIRTVDHIRLSLRPVQKPHQYFLRGSMSALSFPKLPGDVKD